MRDAQGTSLTWPEVIRIVELWISEKLKLKLTNWDFSVTNVMPDGSSHIHGSAVDEYVVTHQFGVIVWPDGHVDSEVSWAK